MLYQNLKHFLSTLPPFPLMKPCQVCLWILWQNRIKPCTFQRNTTCWLLLPNKQNYICIYIYVNKANILYVTHKSNQGVSTQLCLSAHPWSVLTIGQGWRNIHLYTQEHEVQENQQPVADSMAKFNTYALKKSHLEDDPFHQRDGHQASKKWKSQPSGNSGSSSLFLWRVFMQLV